MYVYSIFFSLSSVDGHLGCFHVLGTVNSAVMNNGALLSRFFCMFLLNTVCSFLWLILQTFNPVLSLFGLCHSHIKLKVKLLAQSCPTRCDSMDCSSPDSSIHGILQARILEWVASRVDILCFVYFIYLFFFSSLIYYKMCIFHFLFFLSFPLYVFFSK